MNKNKIIFIIIWFVIFSFVVFIISNLNSTKKTNTSKIADFNIWIVWDNKDLFSSYLETFKKKNEKYKNVNIWVESFSSYKEYSDSLSRAFLWDKAPDIFVINNNEKSIFENQTIWINPNIVNPDAFRKNYEAVFSNDLISSTKILQEDKVEKKVEFLKWVPLWYETLWIYYDMRNLRWKDLSSWAAINDAINYIKTEKWDSLPIWIGNWANVSYASDIMTEFFMQEWAKNLDDVKDNIENWAFSRYFLYGDKTWDNAYLSKFDNLEETWNINENNTEVTKENDLSLFSKWELSMIVWYPRMIENIDKLWFQKSFLRASPIPTLSNSNWLNLVNYNYFVINKNTKKSDLAFDLEAYFASKEWQTEFHNIFTYYLPAMPEIFRNIQDSEIKDWYPVKIKDFYNSSLELSSFDKKLKNIYDEKLTEILNNPTNYSILFDNFKKSILCKYDKIINFTNFSRTCE